MFYKTTLNNGFRIITVCQKQTAESVAVLVLVGAGSKNETKETSGVSHFLEHMCFRGTKKRKNKIEIARALDEIGGIYNAFTGSDYSGYFAKVGAAHFDLALDWVSDIFLNSALPPKEIELEKGVIVEEINMYFDDPLSYVRSLWDRLLYGNQPAGWPILGNKESVVQMTRKKISEYRKNQYVAKNTIVCVAGRINQKEVVRKIKKVFSKIETKNPEPRQKVLEKQQKPQLLLHFRKTDQAHICLGTRGLKLPHPLRYAQELLGIILGGMMSSRLFIAVREKLGIAYYISTSVDSNPDTGYLVTSAGLHNGRLEEGITAILKEYKKVSKNGVPESELKKAKENIKGKISLLLETPDALASFFAGQELLEGKIELLDELFKKIDKVSKSDILKVAREIFRPEKLNLAIIGPFKDKKRFEKLLKI